MQNYCEDIFVTSIHIYQSNMNKDCLCVCVSACGKCYRGQKEGKGGEGEEVYPHRSRDQLGGRQPVGMGFRYLRTASSVQTASQL